MRKLGEGGVGVVYLGYDERLDRRVAVKLVRASAASSRVQARMRREAQGLARLSQGFGADELVGRCAARCDLVAGCQAGWIALFD